MGAPVKQAEVPVAMHITSGVERRTNTASPALACSAAVTQACTLAL